MKKTIILLIFSVLLLSLLGCAQPKNYDGFAQCLTGAGVIMYGASWCPHCQAVKKDFGNSFRFIDYVECDQNTPGAEPEKCVEAGVKYFPMFAFGDGTSLYGEVGFDILSEKTGCELPE